MHTVLKIQNHRKQQIQPGCFRRTGQDRRTDRTKDQSGHVFRSQDYFRRTGQRLSDQQLPVPDSKGRPLFREYAAGHDKVDTASFKAVVNRPEMCRGQLQALLQVCVDAVREASIPDGALPQIHISGCPSSCGTHQTGALGFRCAAKSIDGKSQPAFVLYVNGRESQGKEAFGHEAGTILQDRIPAFLVELGKTVAASGKSYEEWISEDAEGVDKIAAGYLV